MMERSRFTTTYILGGVFFTLIIVIFLVKDPLGILKQEAKTPVVESFEVEEITKIEINSPDISETLEKTGDQWIVSSKDSVKADLNVITAILKNTQKLERGEVASKNKEKHSVFRVDENGVHIKLFAGNLTKADFYVGKSGPQFSSTYIRKEGEDTVYLFKENLIAVFNKDEFRDLNIIAFEDDKLRGLHFEGEKQVLNLQKEDEEWRLTQPLNIEVDETKVKSLINSLSLLRGNDVITDLEEKDTGFDKPIIKVTISFEEEKDNQILLIGNRISDDNDADYYSKREGNETVYTLSRSMVDTFPLKIEHLQVDKQDD